MTLSSRSLAFKVLSSALKEIVISDDAGAFQPCDCSICCIRHSKPKGSIPNAGFRSDWQGICSWDKSVDDVA